MMTQQGQVIQLKSRDRGGNSLWAYRCRLAGRGSKRVQPGGFATESDARAALGLALERARRERGTPTRSLTLTELVDEYLAQHDVEPTMLGKLRGCSARRSTPSAIARSPSCVRRRSRRGA